MITNEDIRWVMRESHDWHWDSTPATRAAWAQRNAEVVERMRQARDDQARLRGQ